MVKRYEPAPHGGMMEREDGRYYHARDVDKLLEHAKNLKSITSPDDINFIDGILESVDFIEGWMDESV